MMKLLDTEDSFSYHFSVPLEHIHQPCGERPMPWRFERWFLVAVAILFPFSHIARSQPATPPTPKPEPKAKQVRTDLFGDPLPPGALTRMGRERARHGPFFYCVVFAPDGKSLASADDD